MGGKENILFQVAEASLAAPDDPVRQVVFPAVAGGEQTLRELVYEYKTKKGPVYRRTVQTTLKASYQLRHSALTTLADANVSLPLLMGKSRHKNLRSLQRYVHPSAEAVAE